MPVEVHRREFDVFLSYAHSDREFLSQLHSFLTKAGLAVCVDETNINAGSAFPQAISRGIERSRAVVIVATEKAIQQGWVKQEINIALDERARDEDFRVIPLKIGDAPVDDLIRAISWISLPGPELTRESGASILRAFYPSGRGPASGTTRDVYISASWRDADSSSARQVCRTLSSQGFRVIGDSRDQEGFGDDRIERILKSCGAFVCVLPLRDSDAVASAEDGPYKYFVREIDMAAALGLPSLVIADPEIRRLDQGKDSWLLMPTQADSIPREIVERADALWYEWATPQAPHDIFLAVDLESEMALPGSAERRLLELVTGMRTVVGNEVDTDPVQHGIMEKLAMSHLVIADLSGSDDQTFNLEVAIEAGMALANGSNLRLMARGRPRRPPFMLRGRQMPTYVTDVEKVALLHAVARSFRRRIVNSEI